LYKNPTSSKIGIRLGALARLLEVDKGYISNIGSGKKNPTVATIQKLVEALGVPVKELFG
jgi:transcriptional regulator with XRE-family HTH domain